MKQTRFLVLFLTFLFVSLDASQKFSLVKLKTEAVKAVPSSASVIDKSESSSSASIAYKKGAETWQFTLSSDQEPQMADVVTFKYKGMKAWFSNPVSDASGLIMVVITPERSLALMYVAGGFDSDKEIKKEDMIKFMDKINLEGLK